MSNYDPFGGDLKSNSPFKSNEYSYGYDTKPKKKGSGLIVLLVILLIGVFLAKYFLFNTAEVSFDIKDIEGDSIDAKILLAKDSSFNRNLEIFSPGVSKEIKKGTYYLKVEKTGYIPLKMEDVEIKEDGEIKLDPLEKNISLTITNLSFEEEIYAGQRLNLIISLDNKSTEEFNADCFTLEGDFKDWNYIYVDTQGFEINKDSIKINPKTKQSVILQMQVPTDIDPDEYTGKVRIKYRDSSKEIEYEVIEEPEITYTFNLEDSLESGSSKTYKLTVDNRKNNVTISDLKIDFDINSENNTNVRNYFPKSEIIEIASKKKIEKAINVEIPVSAVSDNLEGNLVLSSSSFREDVLLPLSLEITEPEINLDLDLSKENVTLTVDPDTNLLENTTSTLTITNNNKVDLDISNIYYENISLQTDCQNLVYISENVIPSKILTNTSHDVLINLVYMQDPEGNNPTAPEITDFSFLKGTTRSCQINVRFRHPYRPDEIVELSKIITVNVN
ncbi:MAG: hypothetical protein PHN22_00325 [Candidatus ainarchaeum sp.]|nr:hypothetical protein [Candidatus ainarchaeum sp.]